MKNNDYRNTCYCKRNDKIKLKKHDLKKRILENHPRQRIIYNKVSDKQTEYYNDFKNIYNSKCAYCGVKQEINREFEIDHFIAESYYKGDKEKAGEINNLVFSCKKCNRLKRDFIIAKEYRIKLNPDENINNIFERDDMYYIRIKEKYRSNPDINSFYEKLRLQDQSRRLDYLFMNMQGLKDKIDKDKNDYKEIKHLLLELIEILYKKRNTSY